MRLFLSALVATALALPASAQTLERIAERGELRLGYRTDAAPLSFANADGLPAGYSVMICGQIAQGIANALQLEDMNADFFAVTAEDRFDKVASGDIDLLCGASTITLGRREIVDFSIPTYVDGTAIMVGADASGQFQDLAGKKLGVRQGTTTQEALTNSIGAAGLQAADVVLFEDHAAGMDAMKAAEIDAYFADQSILFQLYGSSDAQDQFKISNEILTIEKHGLALQRGDSEFRLLVDRILSELYASGAMEEIFVTALPGAEPGDALRALHLIAPTLP